MLRERMANRDQRKTSQPVGEGSEPEDRRRSSAYYKRRRALLQTKMEEYVNRYW